jgi:hypothetical protein
MTPNRRARTKTLASGLSGNEKNCPLPSSHDRLLEAHYFLHRLEKTYHHPDPFRYYLHAFIQAFRSTIELLVSETQNDTRFVEFRSSLKEFSQRDEVRKLLAARDAIAHRESLVPDSLVTVGWFKYGRPKLTIKTGINPLTPSLPILISFRNSEPFVIPVRVWEGEEVGLVRVWRMKSIAEGELLEFCCQRFQELSEMASAAHSAVGASFTPGSCSILKRDYQRLLESDYFPEVVKSWDGPPTELVRAVGERLDFLKTPADSANILHSAKADEEIRGWVGTEDTIRRGFVSILLFSIGGREISENTAAFFEVAKAKIEKMPTQNEESPAEDDEQD